MSPPNERRGTPTLAVAGSSGTVWLLASTAAVSLSVAGSLCSVSELAAPTYQALGGDRHRHAGVEHSHPHVGSRLVSQLR